MDMDVLSVQLLHHPDKAAIVEIARCEALPREIGSRNSSHELSPKKLYFYSQQSETQRQINETMCLFL